jgi:hypothetical protein
MLYVYTDVVFLLYALCVYRYCIFICKRVKGSKLFLFHKFINLKIYSALQYGKKKWTVLKYQVHIFLENFRASMENKYTLKFTVEIEIQIDKLFTLVTSINKF